MVSACTCARDEPQTLANFVIDYSDLTNPILVARR
jgi:hypothetical protein